nr:RES family NAD+ phosphorylase [Limosilactobacillus mucosae]
MKVCANCFCDVDIKGRIESTEYFDICDIHHKKEKVFDTESDDLNIRNDFMQLLDLYEPCSNVQGHEEPSYVTERFQKDWNIFSDQLESTQRREFLESILSDSDKSLLEKPLIPSDFLKKSFFVEKNLITNESWESFKNSLIHKNRFFSKGINTELLLQIFDVASFSIKKGSEFYRARIVSSFDNVKESKDMLIPPTEIINSTEGRLDPKGIGMLYLTNERDVALKEVRASLNDKLVLAKCKLKKNLTLVDLSQINKISPFSFNLETKTPIVYLANKNNLKNMVNDLEKPVNHSSDTLNYIPTQYISSLIQTKFDGIKFTSTMSLKKETYNIALFSDEQIDADTSNFQYISINEIKYNYEKERV